MAFTPGTNEKRRTEGSPRRTSLHRRTEGHGVYFCRVAAAVAGQKACGFHPEPRVSLPLSPFPPTALLHIALFVPRFRSPRLTVFFSFLSPRRSLSLSPSLTLFFSSRYASFYATAQPRFVPASRPFLSLSDTCNLPVSLSLPPPFFLCLSCSQTQPPPSFFRRYPPVSLPLRRANRSRTRASE